MSCSIAKEGNVSTEKEGDFSHKIEIGDHMIRWTHVALWPVQVHAICLGSERGSITLVDFGLTSSKDQDENHGKTVSNRDMKSEMPVHGEQGHHDSLMETVEKYQNEISGPKRIKIVVIRTKKELKRWHKVEYGTKLGKGFWKFFQSGEQNTENHEKDAKQANDRLNAKADDTMNACEEKSDEKTESWTFYQDTKRVQAGGEIANKILKESETNQEENGEGVDDNGCKTKNKNNGWNWWRIPKEEEPLCKAEIENNNKSETTSPSSLEKSSLPKSDPMTMVLARVRYLLNNPDILPPYNVFHSNSECLAVWCKTGRWSTIQASIFLHSTAAGNLKSAISISAMAATTNVTTTTPMWGPLGWAGLSSTTTVGVLSLHPWLIPALAGYGIVTVGVPMMILSKAKKQWEDTTKNLTDGFWEWADHDVYVEAIHSWSKIS